jgi:hypothetical protein
VKSVVLWLVIIAVGVSFLIPPVMERGRGRVMPAVLWPLANEDSIYEGKKENDR